MRPYRLYRNLHRGNFSIQSYIQHKRGYRVTDRGNSILLEECNFKIYETGREKVIREKRKNVHAYVEYAGYRHIKGGVDVSNLREIYYNPYEFESFVYKDTLKKVDKVSRVLAYDNKLFDVSKVLI